MDDETANLKVSIKIGNAEIELVGMQTGVVEIFDKICEGRLDSVIRNSGTEQRFLASDVQPPTTPTNYQQLSEPEKRVKQKKDKPSVANKELPPNEFSYDENKFAEDVDKLGNATMPMVVYAVYFLEDNGFTMPITSDHIFTMYRRYGKVAGHDFRQGISNAKFSGYVRGEFSDVKVTKTGIDYIGRKISEAKGAPNNS